MPTIWSYLSGSAKYANRAGQFAPGIGWEAKRLEGVNGFLVMGYCASGATESLDMEEVVNLVYEQLSCEFRVPFRVAVVDLRGNQFETWMRDWTVSGATIS